MLQETKYCAAKTKNGVSLSHANKNLNRKLLVDKTLFS